MPHEFTGGVRGSSIISRFGCGCIRGKGRIASTYNVDGCGCVLRAIHSLHQMSTRLSTSVCGHDLGNPHLSTISQQYAPHANGSHSHLARVWLHALRTIYPRLMLFFHTIIHWRKAHVATYAHKGRVVHNFRHVIHADERLPPVPRRSRPGAGIRKNWPLSSDVILSTLIVDNFASCG
jgi:hypothetical protein